MTLLGPLLKKINKRKKITFLIFITSILAIYVLSISTEGGLINNNEDKPKEFLKPSPSPSPSPSHSPSSSPSQSPSSSPSQSPSSSPSPSPSPSHSPSPTPKPIINFNTTSLERAYQVKNAMKFAWDSYVRLAWGYDELLPIQQKPSDWFHMGVTIVDSADTLLIMGLYEEYQAARNWMSTGPNEPTVRDYVSTFEGNIRFLGGYLSLYDLTGDDLYLEKAIKFGNNILDAFDPNLIFPDSQFIFNSKQTRGGPCVTLADAGTFFLEFHHLWMISGQEIFLNHSMKMLESVVELYKQVSGIYPNIINRSGKGFCGGKLTLAGSTDSFYEYLLKMTFYTLKTNHSSYPIYQKLFNDTSLSLINQLWSGPTPQGDYYFDSIENGKKQNSIIELACFAGGMYSLSSMINATLNDNISKLHLDVGTNLTKLCAKLFISSPTGVAADVTFIDQNDGSFSYNKPGGDPGYYLRPETIESLFYLYRITGDTIYQDLGWEIFVNLNSTCRTPNGFAGLRNVEIHGQYFDLQFSFFLSETLKYFYLLFSDKSLLPLDKYIFNTEGHPLLIPKT